MGDVTIARSGSNNDAEFSCGFHVDSTIALGSGDKEFEIGQRSEQVFGKWSPLPHGADDFILTETSSQCSDVLRGVGRYGVREAVDIEILDVLEIGGAYASIVVQDGKRRHFCVRAEKQRAEEE